MSAPMTAANAFIEAHVSRIKPLLRDANLAFWEAATTGSDDAIDRSARLRASVKRIYSERDGFARVRSLLSSDGLRDPILRRQLTLLDHGFTGNQLSKETIEDLSSREAELERHFYNFRARLDGREVTNNELRELLETERDNPRRRAIWESSKGIGPLVAEPLRELVRRRNHAARSLGYPDYYRMELSLQEIEEEELTELVEDFRTRTEESFRALRERLDENLARRYGVAPNELRPWHWEDFFSQEAPSTGQVDLDPYFAPLDPEQVVSDYFAKIGLPIDDVLARSDLYEREGKDQHAFCTDIDREGDVRVLCNMRRNERWMGVLLHELGHAVYDKFIPRQLPFLLREPAHTLATESIAMFFGRLTRDPEWLRETIGRQLEPQEENDVRDQQRSSLLIATRWMLVMIHFERELYADPDRPDLNRLWWDLVEEYQLVRRPDGRDEPDWATKIHLSLAPVYYHNYLLGELMASQLSAAIVGLPIDDGSPGPFLLEQVFARGASLPWNDLLRQATGEPLSSRHFVEQFVGEVSGSST
jgi:peptidyl-dipeptidase A